MGSNLSADDSAPDDSTRLVAVGRRVFPLRLTLGVVAVGVGAFLIRPGTLFGAYQTAGVVASFLLVVIGLGIRAWAGANAGTHTRSDFIEAPRLITGGPFAYVRNPIYFGTILLGAGMVGLLGDPWLIPVCAAVFALLYFSMIPAEEAFLRKTFGAEYDAFCASVPRLIPRLTPWSGSRQGPVDWRGALGDAYIGIFLVVIYFGMKAILHWRG